MFFLSRLRRILRGRYDPLVFHYNDGRRVRSADPIEIDRIFIAALGEDWRSQVERLAKPLPLELVGEEATAARAERMAQEEKILKAINAAFDVQPYRDGRGLSVTRRYALLAGYNAFCRDIIELARPFVRRQSRASPGPAAPAPANGPGSISPATLSPATATMPPPLQ